MQRGYGLDSVLHLKLIIVRSTRRLLPFGGLSSICPLYSQIADRYLGYRTDGALAPQLSLGLLKSKFFR